MEQSNEHIEKFVQLFQEALSNNDSIREKAIEVIEHFLEDENILILIDACISIIMSDTVSLTSQQFSFVILCRIFKANTEAQLRDIYQHYQNLTEEMKANLRSAFLRGLLFPEPEIYNQAAYLISLIVVIDDSDSIIIDILELLRDLSKNPEQPETAHYASMISFREIYSSEHLGDLREKCKEKFDEFLINQKNDCIEFLKYGYNYPVNFITEVVKTLRELIVNYSVIFDDVEETNVIYDVFDLMLPQVFDLDLFREIFILIYRLVENLYNSVDSLNIERVINITSNGLTCDNPEFVSIAIDFWYNVACFESKIMDENFLINRYLELFRKSKGIGNPDKSELAIHEKLYNGYCISFISVTISDVLGILTQIDLSDVEIDDPSFKQPYMYAVSLLSKIFRMEPFELFNQINGLYEISVTSDNWIIQHAFLIALTTLSSENKYDCIEDLYKRSTNFIVQCAQSEIDRLSESAVYTLEMIARNYNMYSNETGITQMLELIKILLNRNASICSRSLKLLQKIVSHKNAPVDKLFDDLIEVSSAALGRKDFKSKEIFATVFTTFRSIIGNCTKDSIENIKNFLKNSIVNYLKDVLNEMQSQEITHMMEQSIFQTIITIFKRYSEYLRDEGIEVISLLFNIIQNVNNDLFIEDPLMTISYIIPSFDDDVLALITPNLLEYNQKAFMSNSPSIIKNCMMIITNFFCANQSLMLDQLPMIIDFILKSIKNQDFTPDFYPEVTKNLSYIINAISDNDFEFFDADIRDSMFEIYKSMATLPLDFNDKSGIEFANSVLEATFFGFARILSFSKKEPNSPFLISRDVARVINQPTIVFTKDFKDLTDISNNTLLAFLEMIYFEIKCLSRNLGPLIKTRLHDKLIILAQASTNDELRKKAYKVWDEYNQV